jgi:hypothetical protein
VGEDRLDAVRQVEGVGAPALVCMRVKGKQRSGDVHVPIDVILPLFSTDPLQSLHKLVIQLFNLPIRLRVPQGRPFRFNAVSVERCKVQVAPKLLSVVGEHHCWLPVLPNNVFDHFSRRICRPCFQGPRNRS